MKCFIFCVHFVHCAHGFCESSFPFWHTVHCKKCCVMVQHEVRFEKLFLSQTIWVQCRSVASQELISECLPTAESWYYQPRWPQDCRAFPIKISNTETFQGLICQILDEKRSSGGCKCQWKRTWSVWHLCGQYGNSFTDLQLSIAIADPYENPKFEFLCIKAIQSFTALGWDCTETSGASSDRKQRGGQTSD